VFKKLAILFLLLSSINAIAQDTLNFDLTNFVGSGPRKTIKTKSGMTGMVSYLTVPNGAWQYTDINNTIRVKGNYKVYKGVAIPAGKWEFNDTIGDLVMTITHGFKKNITVYFKPFITRTTSGFDVIAPNHEGVLDVSHYIKPVVQSSRVRIVSGNVFVDNDSLRDISYDSLMEIEERNPVREFIAPDIAQVIPEEENLIENGSFEETEHQKVDFLDINKEIDGWVAAAGTPDYYYNNAYHAYNGKASVGCRFYTEQGNHIEFISTKLKNKLAPGKLYCFKVFVKLKEDCYYAVNALGVYINNSYVDDISLIEGLIKPTISHHGGTILSYKTKWMELSCSYEALGGENTLTLGSFSNAQKMQKLALKGSNMEAYYYFDNIQLYEIANADECPCTMGKGDPPPAIEIGKSIVIKNIFFDNDKWDLLPASYASLDTLYQFLMSKDIKKVEITGHTSSTGSKERNILLSKNRAESVKKYLVMKGLHESLFECIGYGPSMPIADNTTEKGRSENRRVEFKILE